MSCSQENGSLIFPTVGLVWQGRSHQIWTDQVGSAPARMIYPRGIWGHAPPGKFLNLGARLLLRPILGQYDASRRPNDSVFLINAILPIALYTTGVSFPIQFAYRLKATPFAGEACETNCSPVRTKSCWKTRGTVLLHCSQPSCKFQHGTYVFRGVVWVSAKQWR